jgi:hypothetical protein
MPTVKVNLPNRPKGDKVEVPLLGVFENGTTTEVTQERWDYFTKHEAGKQYEGRSVITIGTAEQAAETDKPKGVEQVEQPEEHQED